MGLARLTLAECTDLIPAGSGFLPENWLLEAVPASELTRLVKSAAPQPWLPCPPQGLIELREHIARTAGAERHRRQRRQHRDHLRRLAGL